MAWSSLVVIGCKSDASALSSHASSSYSSLRGFTGAVSQGLVHELILHVM